MSSCFATSRWICTLIQILMWCFCNFSCFFILTNIWGFFILISIYNWLKLGNIIDSAASVISDKASKITNTSLWIYIMNPIITTEKEDDRWRINWKHMKNLAEYSTPHICTDIAAFVFEDVCYILQRFYITELRPQIRGEIMHRRLWKATVTWQQMICESVRQFLKFFFFSGFIETLLSPQLQKESCGSLFFLIIFQKLWILCCDAFDIWIQMMVEDKKKHGVWCLNSQVNLWCEISAQPTLMISHGSDVTVPFSAHLVQSLQQFSVVVSD